MTGDPGKVRVRMAPGPTGPFHIGRSRTALINWLFARHHGGTFVLRIEDTDQERSKAEFLQSIIESMHWLGLDWDEGPEKGGSHAPYYQMGRLDTYRTSVEQLLAEGKAYSCYCTPEELDALREQARAEKRAFRYPGRCRTLSPEAQEVCKRAGRTAAIRITVSDEGETAFEDLILGPISVRNSEIDDFVIVKSDGIPTYNFAVVIDDLTMEITHVIRGQDHVPNTPKQLLLYQALGAQPPIFAHLPLVLGMDKGKMSARHGAEALTAYGRDGFLPEAIVNYLATLGISYENGREIFTREELVEAFQLSRIGRSGAIFDEAKLEWMNGVHIRLLPLEEFVRRSLPFLEIRGLVSSPPTAEEVTYVTRALALEQERVRTLAETPDAISFFLREDLTYDPHLLIQKKSSREDAIRVLESSLQTLDRLENFDPSVLEEPFRQLAEHLSLKTGIVFGTIRVALTGRTAAPPLFDTMAVLGRDRVRRRLQNALHVL